MVFGGGLNGYFEKTSNGCGGVHGGHGVGKRNIDDKRISDCGFAMEMIACAMQFKKDKSKLVTFTSGYQNSLLII